MLSRTDLNSFHYETRDLSAVFHIDEAHVKKLTSFQNVKKKTQLMPSNNKAFTSLQKIMSSFKSAFFVSWTGNAFFTST